MHDILDLLANELIRRGAATSGSIFVNKLPETPNNCIALIGATGTVVGQQRDVPELQLPRFQVVVRNDDYNDASDAAQAVRNVLHGMIGKVLPHGVNTATDPYVRVMRCHVEYEGGPLGEDGQGRSEFSTNYLAEYHHYDPTP